MIRSHITQQLLNYFDAEDARVRESANTLDAQLLNAAAVALEEHDVRAMREIRGRHLATCPLNLDNLGVYHRVQIPVSFRLQSDVNGALLPPAKVVGKINGSEVTLLPFEDMLPTPAGVEAVFQNTPGDLSVAMASPKLGTISGSIPDGNGGLVPNINPSLEIGALPIPNRLALWVLGLSATQGSIIVTITGTAHPQALWAGLSADRSETLRISAEGLHHTKTTWSAVKKVEVYLLPIDGQVDVYGLDMCLPFTPDVDRPFSHPAHREILFDRYWHLDADPDGVEHRLNEVYYENPQIGFPTAHDQAPPPLIKSYRMDPPLSAIALEPNTGGMVAVREPATPGAAPELQYFDRREPMPSKLDRAALMLDPSYGLYVNQVEYDNPQPRARKVLLRALPHAQADKVRHWRYVIELPDVAGKFLFSWSSSEFRWVLSEYNPGNWNPGTPPEEVEFPLAAGPGTYVFTLETRSGDGTVRRDSYPYADLAVDPKITLQLDLSHVAGVAFDARQRLWVWDGNFLHPMRFIYEGYIFDPGSRSLYLTRAYDEVTLQ